MYMYATLTNNIYSIVHVCTIVCVRENKFLYTCIFSIIDLLDRRITFQLQYQLVFCIWMLSFQSDIVEKMKE